MIDILGYNKPSKDPNKFYLYKLIRLSDNLWWEWQFTFWDEQLANKWGAIRIPDDVDHREAWAYANVNIYLEGDLTWSISKSE